MRIQRLQLFDGGQVLGLHHRFKLADVVRVSDYEFDCVHAVAVCGRMESFVCFKKKESSLSFCAEAQLPVAATSL